MLIGSAITQATGQKQTLRAVDINVAPGSVTVLLGPNGCGKSTLLRALALVDPPRSGQIRVDDWVHDFSPASGGPKRMPWPNITMVFQQLFLWPHLSLEENIRLPMRARSENLRSEAIFDHFVKALGLKHLLHRHPNQVSLGERQRAAIIRALVLDPKYLLLDEVTSALDVEFIQRLLQVIQDVKANGTGIILVTHLLGFAKKAADAVVFMDDGAVIETGPANILFSPETERMRDFVSLVDSGFSS